MGTVSKALELLNVFSRSRPLIGLSDLARLTAQNKATCYRLMSELQAHGLVEQVGTGREYRLGPALLRLAALREAEVPTRDAALPVLQALARSTGETAHVSGLVAGELRMIAFAYSSAHAMKVMMEDADHLPFHATSSGLAVLAFMAPNARHAILSQPLDPRTDRTMTDPAALRDRLKTVRAAGIADSQGGFEVDVNSLAVPLFDALGQCSGALAVAAPAQRMTADHAAGIRRALIGAGREMTKVWGGSLPDEMAMLWQDETKG